MCIGAMKEVGYALDFSDPRNWARRKARGEKTPSLSSGADAVAAAVEAAKPGALPTSPDAADEQIKLLRTMLRRRAASANPTILTSPLGVLAQRK